MAVYIHGTPFHTIVLGRFWTENSYRPDTDIVSSDRLHNLVHTRVAMMTNKKPTLVMPSSLDCAAPRRPWIGPFRSASRDALGETGETKDRDETEYTESTSNTAADTEASVPKDSSPNHCSPIEKVMVAEESAAADQGDRCARRMLDRYRNTSFAERRCGKALTTPRPAKAMSESGPLVPKLHPNRPAPVLSWFGQ